MTNGRGRTGDRQHLEVVSDEPPAEVEVAFDQELTTLIGTMYDELARNVGKVRKPLDAEELVADWYGMFMAVIASDLPEDDGAQAIAMLAGGFVDVAREARSTQALAVLRALSALAGTPFAELADAAAAELAAAGIADRPWVTTMTRLEPTTCLRYAQLDGAQESLFLRFRYGTTEHAIAVLIDHDLGGGVKDCWPTDQPDMIRGQIVAEGVHDPLVTVGPVDWVTAERILAEALSRPTCAAEPDQISDTLAHLPLLRRRLDLLGGHPWQPSGLKPTRPASKALEQDTLFGEPGPEPSPNAKPARRTPQKAARASGSAQALVLKVSLYGARPPIWRRLVVPDTITLERLHTVIQTAFEWTDSHLHAFSVGDDDYGPNDGWTEMRSERIRLTRIVDVGDKFDYTYDFGDNWLHTIVVEKRLEEGRRVVPRCLAGRRAAPPEDSGGIDGYEELLATITSPDVDPETLAWAADALGAELGDVRHYDPAQFDPEELNQDLASV